MNFTNNKFKFLNLNFIAFLGVSSQKKYSLCGKQQMETLEQQILIQSQLENVKKDRIVKLELRNANSVKNIENIRNANVKLKSDLKRSTAFVKKLKGINENNINALYKDALELNLSRYCSEIVLAISEMHFKTSELIGVLKMVSSLHQRYADFAPDLMEHLLIVFKTEKGNAVKKRMTLRFLADLYLVGILDDGEVLVCILNNVLDRNPVLYGNRKKKNTTHNTGPLDIALFVSFAKYVGGDFLGISSRKEKEMEMRDMNVDKVDKIEMVQDKELKNKMKCIYARGYKMIGEMYLNTYDVLQKKGVRNEKELANRGEVSEEHGNEYDHLKKLFEKLSSSVFTLSDLLDMDVPELPKDEDALQDDGATGLSLWGGDGKHEFYIGGPFNDEETRAFYEDLPDILETVPAVVLGLSEVEIQRIKEDKASNAMEEDCSENGSVEDTFNLVNEEKEPLQEEVEENTSAVPTKRFDLYVETLEHMVNRERCDKAAMDFCYLNSKSARKRLTKHLYSCPRTHLQLLPYYARLAAILKPVLSDVGEGLVAYLEDEFRYIQKKRNQYRLESKLRNIRFIGELIKFKVAPPIVGFRCLKRCLDDFFGHNIDIGTTLLETCGLYLYRTKYTHERTSNFLEIMMRLKKAKNLDPRAETLIDNAYYQCKPPETCRAAPKEYDPKYLFMIHMLYSKLDKSNVAQVAKTLLKLNFQEKQMYRYFVKAVFKVTKGKCLQMKLVAQVVHTISKHVEFVGIYMVDELIERIFFELEENSFRTRQRHLGYVKLLAEMHNARVIAAAAILEVLYYMLRQGHDTIAWSVFQGNPEASIGDDFRRMSQIVVDLRYDPRVPCDNDSVDNMFRIRLVCVLLETCKLEINNLPTRAMLMRFLTFFQRYYYTKADVPFETEFMFMDTLDRYSRLKTLTLPSESATTKTTYDERDLKLIRYLNWNEAENAVHMYFDRETLEAESNLKKLAIDTSDTEIEDEEELELSDEGGSVQDSTDEDNMSMDEEDVVMNNDQAIAREEDDEFEKAFHDVMQGSIESRKHIARTNVDNMAIPSTFKLMQNKHNDDGTSNETHVMFRVLKRGVKGKVEARELCIPEQTALAQHTRRQENAERAEHSELKRLVLQNVEREEFGQDDESIALLMSTNTNTQYRGPSRSTQRQGSRSRGRSTANVRSGTYCGKL